MSRSSVSGARTWNTNQDTDINVNNYQGYAGYHGGAYAAGAATGAAVTGAAVGSTVTTIPVSTCAQVYTGGTAYYSCGGTYYLPSYQGGAVVYQVVSPPM